jgi:GAF domain-containing protein
VSQAHNDTGLDPKVAEIVRRPSRLRALASLQANAESSAQALDRITRMACRTLHVPVALVNLIGADRQMFLGCGSVPEPWASLREMPVDAGFCPFALDAQDAYAFSDVRSRPDLADNPATQMGVVAYAGVPLRTADGEPVGTLCAVDYEPHEWTSDDLALLSDLAASALAELQLLAATRLAARDHARVDALTALSSRLADASCADDVLDAILAAVDRADAAGLWLAEEDGTLRTAATRGSAPIAADESVAARVASTGEPAYEDVPGGSLALLPLSGGVLGLRVAGGQPLADEDRSYLAALAGTAGLAVESP